MDGSVNAAPARRWHLSRMEATNHRDAPRRGLFEELLSLPAATQPAPPSNASPSPTAGTAGTADDPATAQSSPPPAPTTSSAAGEDAPPDSDEEQSAAAQQATAALLALAPAPTPAADPEPLPVAATETEALPATAQSAANAAANAAMDAAAELDAEVQRAPLTAAAAQAPGPATLTPTKRPVGTPAESLAWRRGEASGKSNAQATTPGLEDGAEAISNALVADGNPLELPVDATAPSTTRTAELGQRAAAASSRDKDRHPVDKRREKWFARTGNSEARSVPGAQGASGAQADGARAAADQATGVQADAAQLNAAQAANQTAIAGAAAGSGADGSTLAERLREQTGATPLQAETPAGDPAAAELTAAAGSASASLSSSLSVDALGNPAGGSTLPAAGGAAAGPATASHAGASNATPNGSGAALGAGTAALPGSAQAASGASASGSSDSAGAPELTQLERMRLVQRVARSFHRIGPEGGEVSLKLHPPALGSLSVTVKLEGQQLFARLRTESPAAQQVLLENLPQLRERLAEQGVEVVQFQVDVATQQEMSAGMGQPQGFSGDAQGSDAWRARAGDYRRGLRESGLPLGADLPRGSFAGGVASQLTGRLTTLDVQV
jgi:flagellar hook-length control protein FliK